VSPRERGEGEDENQAQRGAMQIRQGRRSHFSHLSCHQTRFARVTIFVIAAKEGKKKKILGSLGMSGIIYENQKPERPSSHEMDTRTG